SLCERRRRPLPDINQSAMMLGLASRGRHNNWRNLLYRDILLSARKLHRLVCKLWMNKWLRERMRSGPHFRRMYLAIGSSGPINRSMQFQKCDATANWFVVETVVGCNASMIKRVVKGTVVVECDKRDSIRRLTF